MQQLPEFAGVKHLFIGQVLPEGEGGCISHEGASCLNKQHINVTGVTRTSGIPAMHYAFRVVPQRVCAFLNVSDAFHVHFAQNAWVTLVFFNLDV